MNSPLSVGAATVALALGAAAPAAASNWSQLVAAAGLSPGKAEGMTLSELAAHEVNRDGAADNDVTASIPCHAVCDKGEPEAARLRAGPPAAPGPWRDSDRDHAPQGRPAEMGPALIASGGGPSQPRAYPPDTRNHVTGSAGAARPRAATMAWAVPRASLP
jgi:hypothetical protein